MLWDDVSFVLGSKLCKRILQVLNSSDKPLAPLQIAKLSNIARSNVSTKLKPLSERKLVECINPKSRKWRFYIVTNKGKKLLDMIRNMK